MLADGISEYYRLSPCRQMFLCILGSLDYMLLLIIDISPKERDTPRPLAAMHSL